MRTKRGASVIEVVMALFLTALVAGAVLAFTQTGDLVWSAATAHQDTKDTLYLAINKMAPYMRNGLKIDPSSTAQEAVIVWPKLDAVNGGYALPLTDGDSYSFYLSDATGKAGVKGTILWMAKNGVPDTSWSMKSSTSGAVDLGNSNMSFIYLPASNPDSVQVSMTTTKSAGHLAPITTTTSSTIVLRNCQAVNQG